MILIDFLSAESISDTLHLNIQTTYSNGTIQPGTFTFVFNITTDSACSNVVYSNSSTLTTDSRGIISYYLENVNLNFTNQYYLCYYRDGVLINNSKIARSPYSFTTKNATVSGLIKDANLNMTGYNISADYFSGTGANLTENLTIGKKIIFGFGETIDNLVSGWIKITGSANVTGSLIVNGNINSTTGDICITGGNCLSTVASGTEPLWTANFTAYNTSWSSTYNSSYVPYTGSTANVSLGAYNFSVGGTDFFVNSNKDSISSGGSTASGLYSVALGESNIASGDDSVSLGYSNTASDTGAVAIGYQSTSSAPYSTALGYMTTASGQKSTAFGASTIASSDYAIAMGYSTIASGTYSTAIGRGINVSGSNSVGIGLNDQSGTVLSQANTMSIMGGTVGINTTAPKNTLNVIGTGNITGNVTSQTDFCIEGGNCLSSAVGSLGNISGGGVENYIPKWIGSASLGNSLVYDNGTYVGIGTATPTYLLDVNGSGNIVNDFRVGNDLFVTGWVNSSEDVCIVGGNCLSTVASGTEPLWTANFTAYNSSWSFTYNATYDSYNSTGLIKDWNSSGLIINWSTESGIESDPLWTANFTAYNSSWSSTYNSSYNTAYNYTINGTFMRKDGDNGTGVYNFGGAWNDGGLTISNGNLYAQTVYVYNITSLQVSNLNINGSLIPQIGFDNTFDVGSSSLRWRDLYVGRNIFSNGSINVDSGGDICIVGGNCLSTSGTGSGTITGAGTATYVPLWNGTSSLNNSVIYQNGSKIGINTTIPTATLDVNGNIHASDIFATDVISGSTVGFVSVGLGGSIGAHKTNYDAKITFPETDDISIYTGLSGELLRISGDDGAVGIGESIPVYKLEIKGVPMPLETPSGNGYFGITNISDGDILEIDYSGNVGINTSTPQNKLNVVGDGNFTGNLYSNGAQVLTSYTETEPLWTANFTAYNTSWSSTYNSTYANWNKTYADTLYSSISEPLWTANFTAYNTSWSSTYNASYDAKLSGVGTSGYIAAWNGTSSLNNSIIYQNGTTLNISGNIFVQGGSGDVNSNGAVNSADSLWVKQYLAGAVNLTAKQYAEADVNGDGRVDYSDVDLIEQKLTVEGLPLNEVQREGKRAVDSAYFIDYDKDFGIGNYFSDAGDYNLTSKLYVNGTGNITQDFYVGNDLIVTGWVNSSEDFCIVGGNCLSNSADVSEPLWTANFTAYNTSWSSTYNSSYVPYTGSTANVTLGDYNFSVGTSDFFVNADLSSISSGASSTASGLYSVALGYVSTALGPSSVAVGNHAFSSGDSSIALGHYTNASGDSSIALGDLTNASGASSTATGFATTASGFLSTAMGREIIAGGDYSFAIALNDQNNLNVSQANTMAIMGGNVGIGTATPNSILTTKGNNVSFLSVGGEKRFYFLSNADGNEAVFTMYDFSETARIYLNTYSDSYLNVPTGKFGINTSAPKNTLNVVGDGNFTTNLFVGSNITTEKLVFETSASHYIDDNSTCVKIYGSTSILEIC